ncbi:uncharacterized protein LOC118183433 [Stegodyphus dumicola]|uniref:uncharacterized protein LOC118183433 n=1 Tax=Stegodyphus dumicola TaxID=202533 RepID=UPI0015ACD2D2|nr:uncharacterized protein LOC118183433 [Stegodyphus dumicola]
MVIITCTRIGFPVPSYSTLNKRLQGLEMNFGVISDMIELLKIKGEKMNASDKDCILSLDEMEISGNHDFDISKRKFIGKCTLGNQKGAGNHYLVILLRGLKLKWKQVVSHEITGQVTGCQLKQLVVNVIEAVISVGFNVVGIVSDMAAMKLTFESVVD